MLCRDYSFWCLGLSGIRRYKKPCWRGIHHPNGVHSNQSHPPWSWWHQCLLWATHFQEPLTTYVGKQANTEYLLLSHPPLPLKILPRHIPCLTEALAVPNHVTLKGPLPRHTQKVPGSHQEADCFILAELCLGEFFWNNHFWLMCKAGKLREEEFSKYCQSQKRWQGFEGLQMQERTLGMKNSQLLSGCLALCSTETWSAVLHMLLSSGFGISPINSLNDPKSLCRYTNTSQLLSCPHIRVWKGHCGFHFLFKAFWN